MSYFVNINVIFLKGFFNIVKCVQNFEKAVQYLSLVIIWYSLEMHFLILWFFLLNKDKLHLLGYITEIIVNTLYGFVCMIIVYSISSSMIPDKLIEIRKAKCSITKYINSSFFCKNVIFYLKRIEKEDTVCISACGLLDFTRKYLLSAKGVNLTYNLLIINLR